MGCCNSKPNKSNSSVIRETKPPEASSANGISSPKSERRVSCDQQGAKHSYHVSSSDNGERKSHENSQINIAPNVTANLSEDKGESALHEQEREIKELEELVDVFNQGNILPEERINCSLEKFIEIRKTITKDEYRWSVYEEGPVQHELFHSVAQQKGWDLSRPFSIQKGNQLINPFIPKNIKEKTTYRATITGLESHRSTRKHKCNRETQKKDECKNQIFEIIPQDPKFPENNIEGGENKSVLTSVINQRNSKDMRESTSEVGTEVNITGMQNKLGNSVFASGLDYENLSGFLDKKEIVSVLTGGDLKSYILDRHSKYGGGKRSPSPVIIEEDDKDSLEGDDILGGYAHIDPILTSELIPIKKIEGIHPLLELSSTLSNTQLPIFIPETHESTKYYTQEPPNYTGTDNIYPKCIDSKTTINLQEISKLAMNPVIVNELFNWRNIIQGGFATSAIITALICISRYDEDFSHNTYKIKLHKEQKPMLQNILFPMLKGNPIYNRFGWYGCKIRVNGGIRIISLDDKLPTLDHTAQIYGSRSLVPGEFWVSLLEKAFMSIYKPSLIDIPTHTSLEIYHLTGWIPEIVYFKDIADKDSLWTRLSQNIEEGNILVALGTTNFPDSEHKNNLDISKSTGLINNHSYSVLQARQIMTSQKLMQCKNPISNQFPKLPFNALDLHNWTPKIRSQLNFQPTINKEDNNADIGVFWILWDDILEHFNYLSLAWNPNIYPYHIIIHGQGNIDKETIQGESTWNYKKLMNENICLINNPQFIISIPPHKEDFELRIMLERHINTYKENSKGISFKLFSFDGYKIVYPENELRKFKPLKREVASDVFIFENSDEEEEYAFILLGDDPPYLTTADIFSISFYSFVQVNIFELPFIPSIPNSNISPNNKLCNNQINGEFDPNLTTGPMNTPNFIYNPQFNLILEEPTWIRVMAVTQNQEIPINLICIEGGQDVREIPFVNLAGNVNSGNFVKGFAYFEGIFDTGGYTIVLAANHKTNNDGKYFLELNRLKLADEYKANYPILTPINFEKMKFELKINGKWTKDNSKGTYRILTPEFQGFLKNPGYILNISEETEIRVCLRPTYKTDIPSTCICIFEITEGNQYIMIQEDESYAPRAWGFYSPHIHLHPNKNGYLLLGVNFDRGAVGSFELTIWSDVKIGEPMSTTEVWRHPCSEIIQGKWNKFNGGGCSAEPTFYINPQYNIYIPAPSRDADLEAIDSMEPQIELTSEIEIEIVSRNEFPVGMAIFETNGKALDECDANIISKVVTNATFQNELNRLTFTCVHGVNYNLIVSTYKPHQHGFYELSINSSNQFTVNDIRNKQYATTQKYYGQWVEKYNMGSEKYITDEFQAFLLNPNFFVSVNLKTDIRAHLFTEDELSICLDLYEITESGKYIKLADSGTYSPYKMGVFLRHRLSPDTLGYIFVCSTFENKQEGFFTLELEANPISPKSVITDFTHRVKDPNKVNADTLHQLAGGMVD